MDFKQESCEIVEPFYDVKMETNILEEDAPADEEAPIDPASKLNDKDKQDVDKNTISEDEVSDNAVVQQKVMDESEVAEVSSSTHAEPRNQMKYALVKILERNIFHICETINLPCRSASSLTSVTFHKKLYSAALVTTGNDQKVLQELAKDLKKFEDAIALYKNLYNKSVIIQTDFTKEKGSVQTDLVVQHERAQSGNNLSLNCTKDPLAPRPCDFKIVKRLFPDNATSEAPCEGVVTRASLAARRNKSRIIKRIIPVGHFNMIMDRFELGKKSVVDQSDELTSAEDPLDKSMSTENCDDEPPELNSKNDELETDKVHSEVDTSIDETQKCPKCDYQSSTQDLKQHFNYFHNMFKCYQCPECDFTTLENDFLKDHIITFHRADKPYQCPECNYGTIIKANLIRHVTSVHLCERLYQCSECSYSAGRKSHIDIHIASVHRGDKPYQCYQCNYRASTKGNIKQHVTTVHLCQRPHKCPECDYSSATKSYIKLHVASVHRGDKPYQCLHCNYSASRKQVIKRHTASVHLGEKPHRCPQCSYCSSYKSNLKMHVTSVHRIKTVNSSPKEECLG